MTSPTPEEGFHFATVTCHTSGCESEGRPVENLAIPDDPESMNWTGVVCGACGKPIDDVQT